MPKLGMEPLRRAALVEATIDCIGRAGSLDVTVGEIARTAGMSSALAHHYFGHKEDMFLAAMRHILTLYGQAVRAALKGARTPRARLEAIVRTSFDAAQFRRPVVSAWLNFYVQAHQSEAARRLLAIYQRRLHANLIHALRPLVGDKAAAEAEMLGALIDGIYIRAAVGRTPMELARAVEMVLGAVDQLVVEARDAG